MALGGVFAERDLLEHQAVGLALERVDRTADLRDVFGARELDGHRRALARPLPGGTLHFQVAWNEGAPRRYTIDRDHEDAHRRLWQPFVPGGVDADGDGQTDDRDEVPMAMTGEGGRTAPNGRSASDIVYIDTSDNRGAGSVIAHRLRRDCNGQRFRITLTGRRTHTATIVIALRNGTQVRELVRRR